MVKRSSSKRAYKKRRTVRKSRVIRRRKTTQSKQRKTQQRKTQRGGVDLLNGAAKFGVSVGKDFVRNNLSVSEFTKKAQNFADTTGATMAERARNLKVPGVDALNSLRNMSFQERILLPLGAFVTIIFTVSKMISYIGTYIYIAKLMISNPDYAKQMFELKKQEIQEKNQELAACFETALKSIEPADSGAAPAPATEEPKEESLADILISRLNEFRQSQSKSQFLKDIAKNLIDRKRAEIESLKDNQNTKGIYECLKKALNMVDKKNEEMGAEVEAAPIDDSKLDQAQAAATNPETLPPQQTEEEKKTALKEANLAADTAYEKAKTDRTTAVNEVKKNGMFTNEVEKQSRINNAKAAQEAASAAYNVAFAAARAAMEGGVPETEVKYPKT